MAVEAGHLRRVKLMALLLVIVPLPLLVGLVAAVRRFLLVNSVAQVYILTLQVHQYREFSMAIMQFLKEMVGVVVMGNVEIMVIVSSTALVGVVGPAPLEAMLLMQLMLALVEMGSILL